jgi:23S rRNA G2445 N2-methylase RlmL
LFLNPPYGIRLDEDVDVAEVYRLIATVAMNRFAGWKLAVMTGYVHALNEMKITPKQTIRLYNGAIPCKLYLFDL